ncbi:MAG TPA: [Fe-Fe] hydrogenase large subunit C-terminal domain-containing protein [Candidatus Hydrogenedentes bacterium]|mgnify:FL=1|nr:[Fe-Fe] hydrogenase large subunit C-terminal domain-containing protein [Candidatus Hydrogenedentota bacterium]
MDSSINIAVVNTVKERCRVCFTCVRECPAKAIRIMDGQAEVMPERCIGCGNCVRVCSQNAKQVRDCTASARLLLQEDTPVAALVAPSFPAEFAECDYTEFIGMLRALGFTYVHEVAFGADLVARGYKRLLENTPGSRYIATTCPAIVAYVERYHPELVPSLAPIVSPMVAMARVVKQLHGPDVHCIFVGPCIAKKGEMLSPELPREIDATLAFSELRHLFYTASISPEKTIPSEFDPPFSGQGMLFPISGGMLQAANLPEDLMSGEIVAADGREPFVGAIREFQSSDVDVTLLEVLACEGCISGPGITNPAPLFRRRSLVSRYARRRVSETDYEQWRKEMERHEDVCLTRQFQEHDQRYTLPSEEEINKALSTMNKLGPEDHLNCGACGYDTCREHAIAICKGLAETEMCLPYTIEQLKRAVGDLALSNNQLQETQQALMHSEKLASMGQLAAGIAHELNNPLGVVLMYSHLLKRELADSERLGKDLTTIAEQADRCKKIVAGLLHFARQNKVLRQQVKLMEVVQSGFKGSPAPANIRLEIRDQMKNPIVDIDRDQITQVILNLVNNAFDAMGDEEGQLIVTLLDKEDKVTIEVRDTGPGIPDDIVKKVFEPFFTTKSIGKGTGLGLSITYGIVKMHNGDISLKTNCDPAKGPTGTTFRVVLPRHGHG